MVSKTFCILPWIHVYANPDGSVLPCCIGEHHKHLGNVQTESVASIWNNDKYKTMRKKMLAGEQCEECTACYKSEENGVKSMRQSKLETFSRFIPLADKTHQDGSLDELSLKYFDVRWSNICNFKCRSCSSTYSSSWATEDNKYGHNKEVFIFAGGNNNDKLYNQFLPHFANMEEIYFAGGEPLLTDKHYDMLEHLISIGKTDVELRYNTNLSSLKYKGKNVIDLWKHFSNIQIYVSLDSWGERAEYIREGTEWPVIEENIRLIRKEAPHVDLRMTSVISAFNVYTLPDFLDYLFTNKLFDKNNFYPSFYNLINPHYYSPDIIPNDLKSKIIDKLKNVSFTRYLDQQIKNVISGLENSTFDPILKNQFLNNTNYYDEIRNRDFLKTFPELAAITQ
jgi:radical SAM protein with 4Fe4S-binding SPASM domain